MKSMQSDPANRSIPHEEEWPPRPPWGEPQESAGKIVTKGILSGIFGLPVLLGEMVLEARYHFRLKF